MANKSKAGFEAGKSVRSKVNAGTKCAVDTGETVFTVLKGFLIGLIVSEPAPRAKREFKAVQPKRKTAKAKTATA